MAVQVLGKVAYFNKGAYNSQTNYEINDVVSYNGSSYVSLNDNNQGNLPTNTNYWSVVAEKGDKGDTGKPFVIEKTYSTIESMVADYDNMNVNDYVMIQGSIEEQENATLWTKREVEVSPYKWAYLADFSGASGITGATPNIQIGNVTEGNEPSVTRRSGSSNENPILDFVLKTGAKGDTGATGNGISSIEKTSTSGLVDTYTITFTNGTSTTIEVTNGRSIVSIAKTSSVDYVDTYTITYNDGTTSTFEVANSEVTEEEFDDVVDELNYLYDDLPKVEGEGTNLTLNNTRKGKMSNVLRGNTSQNSTTGKNLQPPITTSTTMSGITFTPIFENKMLQYVNVNGTSTGVAYVDLPEFNFNAGTYIITGSPSGGSNDNYQQRFVTDYDSLGIDNGSGISVTLNTATRCRIRIRIASGYTANNLKFYPMVRLASVTDDTYEPYTNGASPNPDYPQDVHVVSRNNTIKVWGKNLFDGEVENGTFGATGEKVSNSKRLRTTAPIFLRQGTYTISAKEDFGVICYISDSGNYGQYTQIKKAYSDMPYTFTLNYNKYTLFAFNKGDVELSPSDLTEIQIESGTATSYEPYQSASYEIDLRISKNLFDISKISENTYIDEYGNTGSSQVTNLSDYIKAKPNTSYTLSYDYSTLLSSYQRNFAYYDENKTYISGQTYSPTNKTNTITTPNNAKYIRFSYDENCNSIIINEGSTAQPYEPYNSIELCKIGDYQDYIYKENNKWYKHSEIGKVVLDGSEPWSKTNNAFVANADSTPNKNSDRTLNSYSNYFIHHYYASGITSNMQNGEFGWNVDLQLAMRNDNCSTYTDFKTWLSTHNTTVYYILETPTNTEITDQILIAQLDNFEKAISYNTQTNISQENNDLPFIISASAFMSLKYLFGNLETRVAELEG